MEIVHRGVQISYPQLSGKAEGAAVGDDGDVGLAHAEGDGIALGIGVNEVGGVALPGPLDLHQLAVAGVVTGAGAGGLDLQVALLVLDPGVGLQHHHIAEGDGESSLPSTEAAPCWLMAYSPVSAS